MNRLRKWYREVLAVCILGAAALAGGLHSWAQSMPSNWTMYGEMMVEDSPLFLTKEAALDYYFERTTQTAPYSDTCKNYYATNYGMLPYRSARRVAGVWKFDCNLAVTAFKIGATGVATPHGCTPTTGKPSCYTAYGQVTSKNVGPAKCSGSTGCGNPINPGTGNKYQREVDFTVPGSPWLNFVRHYNSSNVAAPGASLGPKWRHSFEYRIFVTSNGTHKLYRPDGSIKTFSSGMNSDAEELGTLDPLLDTAGNVIGWVYDSRNDTKETYDASGRITKLEFKTGGFVNFTYVANSLNLASVTDHFGRVVAFTYSGTTLTKVTAPGGAQYSYGYTSKLLTSMTAPGLGPRQFKYDESGMDAAITPGHLTGIVDASGARYATFKYDFRERGIFSEHAGGVIRFTVAYSDTGPTVVTTPLGATQTMTFASSLGVARLATSTVQCPLGTCSGAAVSQSSYDDAGNITETLEASGFKTCTSYETLRNLPWHVVEGVPAGVSCESAHTSPPAGSRVTTYEWHPQFRAPVQVENPGLVTDLTYDDFGRVLSVTSQSTEGAAAAKTVAFTYNTHGQVLTVDGPRTDVNDVTTYTYGANGNLATVTDPVGNVTTFSSYNGAGQPLQMTLPNGAGATLAYNTRGQPTSVSVAGLATTYTYNTKGLLATETKPDGNVLTYGYDAAQRITSITDQRGHAQQLTLNAVGGVLQAQVVAAGGAVVTQVNQTFDALNRVLQKTGAHVVNPTAVLLNP